MTDEQQVAPSEATENAVASIEASEATENTQGQDQTPPAEGEAPEGDKPEDKSESQKRRERRKAQLERVVNEARAAQQALEESNRRLEKAKLAAQSNTPPQETDFRDYNEYLVALGAYHAARKLDERSAAEIEEATKAQEDRVKALRQQQETEIAQSWSEQVAEAKGRYADFEKVVYTAPISDDLAKMIATSDMGADVAYYLGTHRDQAAALSRMHPIEAARQLGIIEARLSLPQPNLQPSAPDPVSPVRPKPSGLKDPAKMSFEEYRAARKAGKIR